MIRQGSDLVRLETLKRGDVFEDVQGVDWRVDRYNGSHPGTVIICKRISDEHEDCFASRAMVKLVINT